MNDTAGHYVIVGASSAIASALARQLAAAGQPLILAGRRLDAISAQAADLRIRYQTSVESLQFDALQPQSFPAFAARCCELAGDRLAGVIVCYGTLPGEFPDADLCDHIAEAMQINLTSVAQILECFAARPEVLKSGVLVVISSVAGDRGRQSNYLYGAAKAGLTAYASGLRNRLYPLGVHVLTVKPGFTESPMTAGKVSPQSPLLASPDRVARDILRAIRRRKNVIYTPWWWRWIMAIIQSIPEAIFKRLRL